MTFESTTDYALVASIITHPKIYPWVTDDFSPAAADYVPPSAALYVLVRDAGELLGLWMLTERTGVCCEVHTCLLPEGRDRGARAALEFLAWMWAALPRCQRLTTEVPAFNRAALRFAQAAGLVEYGRNPKSFLKRAKLYDLILLGVSRPEGK